MIIKKVTIENYLCYYDVKEFELSNGLNIILGENGEGKTKFFEALEWLFNGDHRSLEKLISAKALAEAEIGVQFSVRVSITVEQYNERKTISKSFVVKKLEDNDCLTLNYSVEGIEENNAGERSQVDGNVLLERIFPSTIRKYSMFKGEAQLDIFKNDDALLNLINTYSSAKHFEKYSVKGEYLREKAEKAVDDTTRSDKNNQREYNRLESEIAGLLNEKNKLTVFINSLQEQIEKAGENIEEAEKYVTNAEALETINERIKKIEDQITDTSGKIDESYTTALFDQNWILVNFEKIHHEFSKKVTELGREKRELQKEFDVELGIKEGKKRMKAELLNNKTPLPVGVPSKAFMDEMLHDKWCKVCNRPAIKGSDAYEFMKKRLEEYLKSQVPEEANEDENKVLFKNDYLSRLFNLGVSHEDNLAKLRGVKKTIKDLFEFNKKRKEDLVALQNKLQTELLEREKVIGSSSIGAEKLTSVLKNYNVWQRDLTAYNRDLTFKKNQLAGIEDDLKQKRAEKDGLAIKSAHTFLIKTKDILRDIEKIFTDTKEKMFDEFIDKLQVQANDNFTRMNIGSFTGLISMKRETNGGKPIVRVVLIQENGQPIYKPGTALNTSMHISILFAISQLTKETKTEGFPIIFDAPTSTYGETKLTQFYDNIYGGFEQAILLTKDFLKTAKRTNSKGENNDELSIKDEFKKIKKDKAIWVKLARPFHEKRLETLNTEIINL